MGAPAKLYYNNLAGALPSEIQRIVQQLSALTFLNLSDNNQLSGLGAFRSQMQAACALDDSTFYILMIVVVDNKPAPYP